MPNFATPPAALPKPLNQFGWRFKYIIISAHGVDVQNLVEIMVIRFLCYNHGENRFGRYESVHARKTRFRVDFFLLTHPSVRYTMLSSVRLSVSVCMSSVCNVRSPYHTVTLGLLSRLKFPAIFLSRLLPWPSVDIHGKCYGDRHIRPS